MPKPYRRKGGTIYWGRVHYKNKEYRRSLETTNLKLAQERYDKWRAEIKNGAWQDHQPTPFGRAIEGFIVEYLPTIKVSSATRYGVSLKWLSEYYADKIIGTLTRSDLSGFEDWRRGLGASNPTIRRDFACLSSMIAFCDGKGWVPEDFNPVPGFMRRRSKRGLKESPPRTRYLTEQEEATLLAAATPNVRDAIIVAIDTGLRATEQFTLTSFQINFERATINTTSDTKNGRVRSVPMPERTAQILAHKISANKKSTYVFAHEDGTRILRMNKGLEGAARRAGIEDLRWHDLRRTAGCRWLQHADKSKRRSKDEVRELLGHSSVLVTEKSYAFIDAEKLAEEVGRTKTGT